MSYARFLACGAGKQLEEYKRESFESDFLHFSKDKMQPAFRGLITGHIESEPYKTIYIDQAFSVKMVSNKVHTECSAVWERLKNKAKITFKAAFLGSLAGLAASVTLGMTLSSTLVAALVVGGIALGLLGFSFFAFYRAKQAADELKLWKDPFGDYIKECESRFNLECRSRARELGDQGYEYASPQRDNW